MGDLQRTIDAVWRIESARIIARIAHIVRDLGLAEDCAQDALIAALEKWPKTGVPENPGAWLMAVGKNRAIDTLRRRARLREKLAEYGKDLGENLSIERPDFDSRLDRAIDDDMLSLVFTACHPILSADARVSLTLKILGGLSSAEIARAYLVQESTIAQRIVRAKRSLSEARVPFETPARDELPARLGSVLEVVYLIFNEGYSATLGDDWMRPALCDEALRLGRILASLMPEQSEVHGLAALMEIQASRIPARSGPRGEPILLLDQNRARWDQLLIRRGLAALTQAESKATAAASPLGPYAIQAEIAACHARALRPEDTDWARISALYDVLSELTPSPVVELNRAVAVSMTYGPAAGLEILEGLRDVPALENYHLLPSVRGDLLSKTGRLAEAAAEFSRAASLTRNAREQKLLRERARDSLAKLGETGGES